MNKRWQIVSDDKVWMFPPDVTLSTIEMREGWKDQFGYQYESCLFFINGNSNVVRRYNTMEEALIGHLELEKTHKLKRCDEFKEF